MKRIAYSIITSLLLVALGFQLGRLFTDAHRTAGDKPREVPANAIDEEALTSWECNNSKIAADSVEILNYKGERADLSTLSGDSTLIARFSASSCKPCVNALTSSLKKFAKEHTDARIVLLLKGMVLRDLYVLAPEFGPQFTLLACESLPVDFDGAETPVLFRLTGDGSVRDHFTCRFGDYARTDMYLTATAMEK